MNKNFAWLVGAVVGIIAGAISVHTIFARSYTAILFWGAAGLALGAFTARPAVRWTGLAYGFFLMVGFLLFGFHGASDKLPGFIVLTLGLSVVSAFCGWLAVFAGNWIRNKFTPKQNPPAQSR